jgi:hypothetical protein
MVMDPIVKILIRSLHHDYYTMLDILLTTKSTLFLQMRL